jgi:hypothetical protein
MTPADEYVISSFCHLDILSRAHLVSLSARWYNLARSATLAQWQSNRFVSDRLSVQLRWVAPR